MNKATITFSGELTKRTEEITREALFTSAGCVSTVVFDGSVGYFKPNIDDPSQGEAGGGYPARMELDVSDLLLRSLNVGKKYTITIEEQETK